MAKTPHNIQVKTGADASFTLSDNQVALIFDASDESLMSSTGNSILIASSRGTAKLTPTSNLTFGLNVMKKITLTKEEIKDALGKRKETV